MRHAHVCYAAEAEVSYPTATQQERNTMAETVPARIASAGLGLQRKAEAVLRELRVELSEAASKIADERGEPPLQQQ